jgi:hypothetical protein
LYEKVNSVLEYIRITTGIRLGGQVGGNVSSYGGLDDDALADGVAEQAREKYLAGL